MGCDELLPFVVELNARPPFIGKTEITKIGVINISHLLRLFEPPIFVDGIWYVKTRTGKKKVCLQLLPPPTLWSQFEQYVTFRFSALSVLNCWGVGRRRFHLYWCLPRSLQIFCRYSWRRLRVEVGRKKSSEKMQRSSKIIRTFFDPYALPPSSDWGDKRGNCSAIQTHEHFSLRTEHVHKRIKHFHKPGGHKGDIVGSTLNMLVRFRRFEKCIIRRGVLNFWCFRGPGKIQNTVKCGVLREHGCILILNRVWIVDDERWVWNDIKDQIVKWLTLADNS